MILVCATNAIILVSFQGFDAFFTTLFTATTHFTTICRIVLCTVHPLGCLWMTSSFQLESESVRTPSLGKLQKDVHHLEYG